MPTPISPKVIAFIIAGIFLSSLQTNIALITPGMLSFLGPWAPFVYGTITTAGGTLAGYFFRDGLRDAGAAAAAAARIPAPAAPTAPLPAPAPLYQAPPAVFPAAAVAAVLPTEAQAAGPGPAAPAPATAPAIP